VNSKPSFKKVSIIVATCALAGAGAGIAGSMAAPKGKSSSHGTSGASGTTGTSGAKGGHHRFGRHGGPGRPGFGFGPGGGPVHAEAVIPNRAGDGFVTVTSDAGKLKSVDGTKLTITEGTAKAVYKTVEIDVGDNATVDRNHKSAKVSDLQAGDFIAVMKGPDGYFVHAESAAFRAVERKRGPRFGPGGFRDDGDGPGDHGARPGPGPGAGAGVPGGYGPGNRN
jgi:hypothetical protein